MSSKVVAELRAELERKVEERGKLASAISDTAAKNVQKIMDGMRKLHPRGIPDRDLIVFCDLCDRSLKRVEPSR